VTAVELTRVTGSCHCGTIRFEALLPAANVAQRCNCSICAMTGFVHLLVPADRFRLLSGESSLRSYCFNTGVARHLFCGTCGIKSFYVPRSHPQGFSLNLRCLELPDTVTVSIEPFDGQHWERHAAELPPLPGPG
jgi:hypothetical protein